MPQGSYLEQLHRRSFGRRYARRAVPGGRWARAAQRALPACTAAPGDIGNSNGSLQCNFGGRAEAVPPREPGYGSDRVDRCAGLHRESEELRAHIDREFNPLERTRMEGHLRELHEQEEALPLRVWRRASAR